MEVTPFVKNPKQVEALDTLNRNRHALLFGGARSGKTFIIVRNIFIRATMKASKHLIVRFRFNHARTSLNHETIPKVLAKCFPDLRVLENKADGYWVVPTRDGGESQVWIGGTDDQERIEKVLGNEYSTIYANECSQISFDAIILLWTRLAENSGLSQRFYYDCNPPGKKHWSYKLFFDGKLEDDSPSSLQTGKLLLNPTDNAANLTAEYIDALKALPKRQRQRFLEGLYLSDVEGALWTDIMVNAAKSKEAGELVRTVIAVDPSLSNNRDSDECGIVAVSLDEYGDGVVHRDLSGKMSTREWAQKVVSAYHVDSANVVVAEKNVGGDLVRDAIQNIDPNVPVKLVHASVGKFARAEPVSQLYELGKVSHERDMPHLEAEMTEWLPKDSRFSPNRLDALVYGLTYLMIGNRPKRIHIG